MADANQNNPETPEAVNFLDLPDEEVMNMDFDAMEESIHSEETVEDEITEEVSEEEETELDDDEEVEDTSEESIDNEETDEDTSDNEEELANSGEEDDTKDNEASNFMEQVMAPFKANGKEFTPQSVDEVRRLMSMGAGFHKKMEQVKPHLKIIRTLQEQNLLDEGKINHLIDLSQKDPNAIAKLLKDSDIDPLSIDVESGSDYKPKTHTVDDKQIELESALEDISSSPHYQAVANVIGNELDEASRNTIYQNPTIIQHLNNHMETGTYEKVMSEVEHQKTLGQLNGLSDIEAYWKVGEDMAQRGAFNQASNEQPKVIRKTTKNVSKPDPQKASRRKAASSKNSPKAAESTPNYLEMSDEEFEKQFSGQY